ncbi:MAG TPA: TolC family protein [Bryobacteraceae bacterium]
MRSFSIVQRTLVVAALLLSPLFLFAQAPGPSLSLRDAEAMALKNHPQVLASQALSLEANQITREARAAYYPVLNGDVTGGQANRGARLGAGVLNDPSLFSHFGTGVSLSQLITDCGRTSNLVANAKFGAAARQQDYRATRYDIVLGVDQAYYDTLLAEQLVKVSEETVKTRQTIVDQVSQLFKNKLKSQVDLSFAQVNLSDAKLMLLRANNRLTAAYAALGQALGTQNAIRYQLADQPPPPNPPDSVQPLIDQAYRDRPELASMRLQQEAAQKFAYAERDLKRPSVSLMAVGGALPYIRPGNTNSDIPGAYESAAINVHIPVFNGHLFSARRQAAEYQLEAVKQRARDLQNSIARDVRAAWARARTAHEAIGATEELLQQANLALSLAQGRYQLGLASIVELTQAQLGQTQAEVENVTAKYDYEQAYAALQYTLGALR